METKVKFRAKLFSESYKNEYIEGAYIYDRFHKKHFILSYDLTGMIRETRINPETLEQIKFIGDK